MLGRAQQYMHGMRDYGVVIFNPVYPGCGATGLLKPTEHRKYHFPYQFGMFYGIDRRIEIPSYYILIFNTHIKATSMGVSFLLSVADYMTYLSRRCRYYMCTLTQLYPTGSYVFFNRDDLECDQTLCDKRVYRGPGSYTTLNKYEIVYMFKRNEYIRKQNMYEGGIAILMEMMTEMAENELKTDMSKTTKPVLKVVV